MAGLAARTAADILRLVDKDYNQVGWRLAGWAEELLAVDGET